MYLFLEKRIFEIAKFTFVHVSFTLLRKGENSKISKQMLRLYTCTNIKSRHVLHTLVRVVTWIQIHLLPRTKKEKTNNTAAAVEGENTVDNGGPEMIITSVFL